MRRDREKETNSRYTSHAWHATDGMTLFHYQDVIIHMQYPPAVFVHVLHCKNTFWIFNAITFLPQPFWMVQLPARVRLQRAGSRVGCVSNKPLVCRSANKNRPPCHKTKKSDEKACHGHIGGVLNREAHGRSRVSD